MLQQKAVCYDYEDDDKDGEDTEDEGGEPAVFILKKKQSALCVGACGMLQHVCVIMCNPSLCAIPATNKFV